MFKTTIFSFVIDDNLNNKDNFPLDTAQLRVVLVVYVVV